MSSEAKPRISGVVGILTDDKGHVIVSCSDFDQSSYGGFRLLEAQRMRVKLNMAELTIRAYCSEVILKVLDSYQCSEIVGRLCRDHGFTATYINVGHEDQE